MIKKKTFFILLFAIFLILIIFFIFMKKDNKVSDFGNNKSSQEIVNYILNMSSYSANVSVEVSSNKNKNTYVLEQKYVEPNIYSQEVIEPSNIKGLKIVNDGESLKLENTGLSLTKVYENYNYMTENDLDLVKFVTDYSENEDSKFEEKDGQIIMQVNLASDTNKRVKQKKLYIDLKTANPIKLEIIDFHEKVSVYILYNEIKINNLNKEDVVAFELEAVNKDI